MLAAIVLAALLQASAEGAEAPPTAVVPHWVRKPTSEDIMRVYPRAAEKRNQPGRAAIGCDVVAKGKLANCKILSEDPEGVGFGEAAVKLGEYFQMSEVHGDARTEGGTVRIPIRFQIGDLPPLVRTPAARLTRGDGLRGRVTVRCRVATTTPKPEFEACAVLDTTLEALNAEALDYVSKLPLPSGTAGGLNVAVPVVFGDN